MVYGAGHSSLGTVESNVYFHRLGATSRGVVESVLGVRVVIRYLGFRELVSGSCNRFTRFRISSLFLANFSNMSELFTVVAGVVSVLTRRCSVS